MTSQAHVNGGVHYNRNITSVHVNGGVPSNHPGSRDNQNNSRYNRLGNEPTSSWVAPAHYSSFKGTPLSSRLYTTEPQSPFREDASDKSTSSKCRGKAIVIVCLLIIASGVAVALGLVLSKVSSDDSEQSSQSSSPNRTQLVVVSYDGSLRMLDRAFTSDLYNPSSQAFKDLQNQVCSQVAGFYAGSEFGSSSTGCVVILFSPGSVNTTYRKTDTYEIPEGEDPETYVLRNIAPEVQRLTAEAVGRDPSLDGGSLSVQGVTQPVELDPSVTCTDSQFGCDSGGCIPASQRCDITPNCPDGSDEQGCECTEGRNFCRNGGTCAINDQRNATCACATGYTGTYCTDIVPCGPFFTDPCENGGTCSREGITLDYVCTCTDGYEGQHCGSIIPCGTAFGNPCANGGTCTRRGSTPEYQCQCADGYEGTNCTGTVPCGVAVTNPCNHGGTCSRVGDSQDHRCSCAPGYEGDNCDDIVPCGPAFTNPCQHEGTCSRTGNTDNYTCACSDSYTGSHCENALPCVESNPCSNNGTCVRNGSEYSCTCPQGYMGQHCQDTDPCGVDSPCENGGTCVVNGTNYTCNCAEDYTGYNCTEAKPCVLNNPCNNGGTCVRNETTYNCSCTDNFTGDQCDDEIPCSLSNPCSNNGTCIAEIDTLTYRCNCTQGWEGTNCTDEVPCALKNPCSNGGTCTRVGESFSHSCTCTQGWEGDNCTDANGCVPVNPCNNNGTCTPDGGSYDCACLEGWMGDTCDTCDPKTSDICNEVDCGVGKCEAVTCTSFTCRCEDGSTQQTPCTCGGTISEEGTGLISSPYYNLEQYPASTECVWVFSPGEGRIVRLQFLGFDLESSPGCIGDSLNVYNGSMVDSDRLLISACGSALPNPIQSLSAVTIRFKSDRNNQGVIDLGFSANYSVSAYVSPCAGSPCVNGGTCEETGIYEFTCNCPAEHTGIHCETADPDPCSPDPCLHGTCTEISDYNYTCTCQPGYVGLNCSDMDPCLDVDCYVDNTPTVRLEPVPPKVLYCRFTNKSVDVCQCETTPKCPVDNSLGVHSVAVSTAPVFVASAEWPDPYPGSGAGQQRWTFSTQGPSQAVRVTLLDVRLADDLCTDSVVITQDGNTLREVCGGATVPVVTYSRSSPSDVASLSVEFNRDNTATDYGFIAVVTADTGCTQTLNAINTSQSYVTTSLDDVKPCTYVITSAVGQGVEITVDDDKGLTSLCGKAWIEVDTGAAQTTRYTPFCGNQSLSLNSTTNKITVWQWQEAPSPDDTYTLRLTYLELTDPDDCRGHHCAAGSTCEDLQFSYRCNCQYNYTGEFCEIFDECSLMECYVEDDDGADDYCLSNNSLAYCSCRNRPQCQVVSDLSADVNISSTAQFVSTPNWPSPYPDGISQDVVIRAGASHLVVLEILELNLEGRGCKDPVSIYDGVDTDELLYQLCDDSDNPGTIRSVTDAVTIKFRTDANVNRDGFLMLATREYDDCSSNPCVYGTCIDEGNSFSCSCDSGYLGQLCDTVNPRCAGITCHNNGKCVDFNSTHAHCQCLSGFSPPSCAGECGKQQIAPKLTPSRARIIGGTEAVSGSWPWMASMRNGGSHFCGGTLVGSEYIVTAAHCNTLSGDPWFLGFHDSSLECEGEEGCVEVTTSQIWIHEDYNDTSLENDIAVVKFHPPVTYTERITPICVREFGEIAVGTSCWIAGWGRTDADNPVLPDKLQQVAVEKIPETDCSTQKGFVTENMFCAGDYHSGGRDSCQGDSGGPLMCVLPGGEGYTLAGISSWGFDCGQPYKPGIYTKVRIFINWINSIINPTNK